MNILTMIVVGLLSFWLVSWILEEVKKRKNPDQKPLDPQVDTESDDQQPSSFHRPADPISAFCRELELNRPFTKEQLKEAYRKKISEYHPDKVGSLGKEIQDLAVAKSKSINTAYERLQGYADD